MAFSDALDLRSAVIEETAAPELVDRWPRLVALAESAMNRRLRTRHQITVAAVTIASGVAALPDDYLAPVGLFQNGCPLAMRDHQISADVMRGCWAVDGLQIVGPDGDYDLHYYAKLPTLSADLTASNWLLEQYPSVYLWGVTAEAFKALRQVEQAAATGQMFEAELRDAARADASARFGASRIRVAGVNP